MSSGKYKCKFQSAWLIDERFCAWIRKAENDLHATFCSFCQKNLKKSLTFIRRQKIDFTLHVFLDEILQRYCKLNALDTLGMPGYAQKVNFIPHAFLQILLGYANLFGYYGHAWLYTLKMIVSTCRRLQCLSACQNKLHHSLLSLDVTFS